MIAKISGRTVKSAADVQKAVKAANGKRVLMLVKNKRGARFVAIKPAKTPG